MIKHNLRDSISFQFDNDPHTISVRLVSQIGDSFQTFIFYKICYIGNELTFIDLIGKFGHDDTGSFVFSVFFKFRAGTEHDLSPAGGIRLTDSCTAHDDTPGGEVRTGHTCHQIIQRCVFIFKHTDAGIDDLGQVVRRNVGCHADGDAVGTVHQKVRETGGENPRFFSRFIEVGIPVYGLFFNIPQHLLCHTSHSCFRITVCSRRVAIDGAEVTVSVDQRIAHGKVLCQSDQSIIDRCITMGMVTAQYVADCSRTFPVRLVSCQTVLIHCIQNTAMDRFQSVAYIRQGTSDDNRHCIFYIAGGHFMDQFRFYDHLVRKTDLFRLIIFIFCHLCSVLLLSN